MKSCRFTSNAITKSVFLVEIKLTISLLVLSIFLPFTVFAQTYDLTGYWKSDVDGCYQIRQNGNEVFWAGGPGGSGPAHNVFHGAIAGNTLTGLWYDLPANPFRAFGASLSIRIESNSRIVKVSESAPYKASVWIRTNGPCNTSGGGTAEPTAKGLLTGEWNIQCCNNSLGWTLSITNQDGNSFSGSFSANQSGGDVTHGKLNGTNIEFDRSGTGWTQHWSGQLVNDGGGLRIVNGIWTGSYVERYTGQNNWHAEKKK